MKIPPVEDYGSLAVESFDNYYARWPAELSNFPKCVVENWIYRHWSNFRNAWHDRSVEAFSFALVSYENAKIMQIGHTGNWEESLDHWGDELFRNQQRQSTWLARYMLSNGTSPAPIIVAPDASGLEHPDGLPMHAQQLIEGHMRLAYLRGMVRHSHPRLKPLHMVWQVSLPNNSFKPKLLRGSA